VASELVVPRPPSPAPSVDDIIDVRVNESDATDAPEVTDSGCVVCGEHAPEVGACCSSRCAGEAQRQLRRNAARLRRLGRRDAQELRLRLAERNGRLMSAILRWRPEGEQPSLG
jgi:hypothetical protein